MKHIFVFNPTAGQGKTNPDEIRNKLSGSELDYEIYITKYPGDTSRFVKEYCENHKDENTRFYACGGDGTIKGVVDGVFGYENAEFSVYPIGSGNDFVKYYGGREGFLDLPNLVKKESHYIDAIKVGDEYCVNVLSFGFDSAVCDTMIKIKNKKLIGGKNAYTTGIVKALFTAMKNDAYISIDGKLINESGKFLLSTCANASFVGGAYNCAPIAVTNDGLLEISVVKPISVFKLISLIGYYKKGTHLFDDRFSNILHYERGKELYVESDKPFYICLDGDLREVTSFKAEIVPHALKFAAPVYPERNTLIQDLPGVVLPTA